MNMALTFEQQINLTEYADNPAPKIVQQLSIIHEARDGELVQYYIDANRIEGDKSTHAIGIAVFNEYGQIDHYDYTDYTEVEWNEPAARMTRQRIDRLSVKAFPGVGAIAAYKLAYRNLSQIVAPVNYNKARQKAPTLQAEISSDQYSVTFTISNPIDPQTHEDAVTYIAFRICLVLDYHQLEYITYEKTLTVTNLPISANYLCYAIGYINEGEICSYESNSIVLNLKGIYDQWPVYSPGHQSIIQCFVRTQGTSFTADWLSLTEEGNPLVPDKATIYIIKSGAYAQQNYYWDGTKYQSVTSGNDVFVNGLTFMQDKKLRATLTNGHNVDSINKVPTTERIACELLLSNWEEIEGHWEQTVIDSSIKDDDIFGEMYVEFTGSPQIDTLNNASLGCIAGAITSNGSITFYCYGNKPNANVTIYANRG